MRQNRDYYHYWKTRLLVIAPIAVEILLCRAGHKRLQRIVERAPKRQHYIQLTMLISQTRFR